MNAPAPNAAFSRNVDLERRLTRALAGEVKFDAFTRGRYATDASIYQIMPAGVVFPKSVADVEAALTLAREAGVPVIARGAGTSQNGQPIGSGLVIDFSRHFNAVLENTVPEEDGGAGVVTVRPGIVLEHLNARLRAQGWFFPVEPSTASRCTIGGMTGNNSCGARSIRYGKMVDNVLGVGGLTAAGDAFRFDAGGVTGPQRVENTAAAMLAIARRERDEIERMFPKVQRRVGGYNLDALLSNQPNLAHLMVGSEGTLALTTEVTLKLARLPAHRVMGVCHFPSFRDAMETTRHLVALGPVAVELVDNNVLVLGKDIPLFQRTLADITKGTPDCLLLVEFAGEDLSTLKNDLRRLDQCMADYGFRDAVVEVVEAPRQKQVWEMREACLNIMMSMKGDGKPVSFIEDCAVPLEHLADYTDAITALFARHNTRGTWYAHASVGCLHVRPILNMKDAGDIAAMRAIAEAACDLVRQFKGSHSGEHGDGISRSEFHERMFGTRLVRAFEEVKDGFDAGHALNPGKIVRALRMDDRGLTRYREGYRTGEPVTTALDWSEWGGFGPAVEMCNNNGTCRKTLAGSMCPSYRVTREEKDVTRGRANTLRLAISGQLGPDAFTSPQMKATLDLCVSCKSCKLECPTGVDMAKMKIEFLHHYHARHGLGLRERLIAYLPRYAPLAARLGPLLNLAERLPAIRALRETLLGFSARRSLPRWHRPWRDTGAVANPADVVGDGRDLILFGDTFNRYFEPGNLDDARAVLCAAGYRLHRVEPEFGGRPLCCGRTFLSAGQVAEARHEAERTVKALRPFVERGARVVGLEPSCMMSFRDEFFSLLPRAEVEPLAGAAMLIEEALAADLSSGLVRLDLADQGGRTAHVHGHCHQKAFGAMGAVETVLRAVPGLTVKPIESSCCGMSGAFGYASETIDVSMAMGEAALLPAVRKAGPDDLIVADGTSCRHQIGDGAGRNAIPVASLLARALKH